MTLAIFPQAIAPDWDVPGGYARYTFGVDSSGEYQSVLKCLLVAPTSTSSSLPLNTPTRVKTPDEVDTLIGARELLAQGARTALELKGVPVYVMRVEDPDGGTASTLTVTATGTSSAFGRYWFTLGRTRFSVSIPSGTTQASAATKIRDAFLAQTRLPTTAATTSNVTTLTIVTPGASGNHWILAYDDSEAPAGQSIAITGGTAFADGIRYQFGNGTGFEDLQAGFDAIYQQTSKVFWYERSAWSSTDTDNAAAIRDFMWDQAEPTIGRPQAATLGHNGTYSAASAISIALNDAVMRVGWKQYALEHPFQIGCALAVKQAFAETRNPNTLYDDQVVDGIGPFFDKADRPNDDTLNAAIQAGLTVITSDDGASARVVQLITTWATKNGLPFKGVRDVGKWATPIYVGLSLLADWAQYRTQNPFIRDNWSTGESPVQGVGTPRSWEGAVNTRLKNTEKAGYIVIGTLVAESHWLTETKAFGTYVPVYVTDLHHQTGLDIQQVYR